MDRRRFCIGDFTDPIGSFEYAACGIGDMAQSALSNANFTLYDVYCILYIVQCKCEQCRFDTVHIVMCDVHCTLYTLHYKHSYKENGIFYINYIRLSKVCTGRMH